MNQITLNAVVRNEQGSNAAGRLRRAGKIPGVIKRISGESTLIAIDAYEYEMTMRGHKGNQALVTLKIGETEIAALTREIQNDVITGKVSHLDFGEVDMNKTVRVEIALNITGTPDGVKNGGGILQIARRSIHVDCLPADIIEIVDVDVSALKVGESLTAAQIQLGDKYSVTSHKNSVIAIVAGA